MECCGLLELDLLLVARCSPPQVEGAQSRAQLIMYLARREKLTVRQLIGRPAAAGGIRTFNCIPEQVGGDDSRTRLTRASRDGSNVMLSVPSSGLEGVVIM